MIEEALREPLAAAPLTVAPKIGFVSLGCPKALTDSELILRFEEHDGIAKLVRLNANGIDVELFHILTFT